MTNSKVDTHSINGPEAIFAERLRLKQQQPIFDARFRRCYGTLHLIASRVLGGPVRAEEAIGNCWRMASRHPRRFDHEGEFHSWLLRVLIDEALVFLRESEETCTAVLHEPVPAQVFRSNEVSNSKDDMGAERQDRFTPDMFAALD